MGKTCRFDWFVPEEKDGKVVRVKVAYSDVAKKERGEVWVTPEQIEAWPSAASLHGPVLVEWAIEGKITAGKITAGKIAAGMIPASPGAAADEEIVQDFEDDDLAAPASPGAATAADEESVQDFEDDDLAAPAPPGTSLECSQGSSSAAPGAGDSAGAGDSGSELNLGDLSLNLKLDPPFTRRRRRM
jgi:hypothetical protein